MNLILRLPAEISCDLVGKWLYLEDITRLDTAFCNAELRTVFHREILHSSHCILADAPRKFVYNNADPMHWFVRKGIRSEVMPLSRRTEISKLLSYVREFGSVVRSARFENMPIVPHEIAPLSQLAMEHCPNLTSIVWSNCDVSDPLITLLQASSQLTSLSLQFCDAKIPLTGIPATHHLQLASLDMACEKDVETMVLNMCVHKSIQKLRLFHFDTQDWSKFTNLRSLQINVGPHNQQHALQLFQNCPQLANLDIAESTLTDELLTKIITHLCNLRTLNIENAYGLTDRGLMEIAARLKDTLEALYALSTSGITSIGVNRVLDECPKLHTISFTAFLDIDYSLMSRIGTFIMSRPDSVSVYASIVHHCRNVHSLHVAFPTDEATSAANIEGFITLACELPSLRSLFVVEFSRYHSVKLSVNDRRPAVLLTEKEEYGKWYDLFAMPI